MGYLLKEALKTLCGVNQWSYAIFWKIGCQNPKLLIWEDCYYENSGTSISLSDFEPNNGQLGIQAENRVHFLVTKMMMDNHVNVVGEGLIGRAAFTGTHQWILSHNYNQEVYSPEVLKEVFQQFSAGMQTIAVIPVLPHGVVQLASKFPILENSVFVEDVKNLVLQLGCIPGILLSENYGSKETIPNIGIPVGKSSMAGNYSGRSTVIKTLLPDQNSCSVGQIPMFSSSSTCPTLLMPHATTQCEAELMHSRNVHRTYTSQQANSISKAEVIPADLDTWLNQSTARSYISRSNFDLQAIVSSSPSRSSFNVSNRLPVSNLGSNAGFASSSRQDFGGELDGIPMSCMDSFSVFESLSDANLLPKTLESGSIADSSQGMNNSVQRDLADVMEALGDDLYQVISIPHSDNEWKTSLSHPISDPVCKEEERRELGTQSDVIIDTRPCSGDDLFDILGVDFKSKLLNGSWSNSQDSGSESSITNLNKKSSISAVNRGQSDNVTWDKDHLLDAMISSIQSSDKQILDDNTSCKTTITNTSSKVSGSCSEVGISGRMQAELFGFTKPAVFGSSSFKPESCKNGLRSYSQGSSLYGSQISSWIDQGHENNKPTSSVSTGYSKKTDDTGKTNRKRLKPGENPRPRPKDRQMIQDRVKELREIVPNGAKCSIDALLERTIKHMLFLQSVTKHADKLKQSGESKIFNKEGGLRMKDNSNGGATWAYEVGSQSTVCPIIVEDLNQPRQMLIEMLCEERGLFLEIADIVRGLGLTILKGVMETQKDKIWARFTVEANRDVTRMEIFVSLVRLLEQNTKNGVPAGNNTDNDATMVHRFPLPGTSIPVTGRLCSLQ